MPSTRLRRIYDPADPESWAARARRKRFALFESIVDGLPEPVRILDVGGTESFWRTMSFTDRADVSITLLNRRPAQTELDGFVCVQGEAQDMGDFADDSFDLVFSNSVIEHVGGPEDQKAMADEVRRVGKRFFVQTPNRYFPIEPHFVFPFFQFLPVRARAWLVSRFDLGWVKRQDPAAARDVVESVRLLGRRRFRSLFPDSELFEEKFLGLTKSFVVYTPPDDRGPV